MGKGVVLTRRLAVFAPLALLAAAGLLLLAGRGEGPPHVSPYAPADGPPAFAARSPLLVAVHARGDNPYGRYLAEILRAEGLNEFRVVPASDLDDDTLARVDAVLLAEGPLGAADVQRLERYVSGGGRLIAMRPDVALAAVLGIERAAGACADGYVIVADHPIGRGIAGGPLQYHGAADHYRLAGAAVVAWLTDASGTAREFPAVTVHRYGRGQAALWAFDLARSVAYTRQGNPQWTDHERDGLQGIRATDLFAGWVDLERIAIPQADEQQRLLANLLAALSEEARPLPRLWYFPGAAAAMLIATGDAHAASAATIDAVLGRIERRGGRFSVYYAPRRGSTWRRAARRARWWAAALPLLRVAADDPGGMPAPSRVGAWRARGHEFALHPDVGADGDPTSDWQAFTGSGYGPVPPTMRTHAVRWSGWVDAARVQAGCGVRMNLDSYHVGPAFRRPNGEWAYGHFTGSGLPMKFVDEHGRVLEIYQQVTPLVDEQLIPVPWSDRERPDAAAAVGVAQALLRRALESAPAAVAAQFHVDLFDAGGQFAADAERWFEGTVGFAAEHDIPIWTAQAWLHFTEVRHDASFDDVAWDAAARRLSFRLVAAAAPEVELTVMVPLWKEGAGLTEVSIDGERVPHRVRRVGGVEYGWVDIAAGFHRIAAEYATGAAPPAPARERGESGPEGAVAQEVLEAEG